MTAKIFAYKRVSTAEQSTARQLADCEQKFDFVFEDKASGKDTEGRPQLQALLCMARDGDSVYVHSMDRLARNLQDLLGIVTKLNGNGVTVVFVKEGLTFDGSGNDGKQGAGMGKFLLSIFGAVAEFERALIRERQAEGIAQAQAAGTFKGRPPVDPEKVAKADAQIALGVSVAAACRNAGISRASYYRAKKAE